MHFVVLFCSFEDRILTSLDFYVVKTKKKREMSFKEKMHLSVKDDQITSAVMGPSEVT